MTSLILCLAINLWHEARGTNLEEYYAISNVVMNRVNSNRFPSDVCEVIVQPSQFSWTLVHDLDLPKLENPIDERAWDEIVLFSKWFLDAYYSGGTYDITNGSTHYAKHEIKPYWSKNMDIELISHSHTYYREENKKKDCIVGSDRILEMIESCPTTQLTFYTLD